MNTDHSQADPSDADITWMCHGCACTNLDDDHTCTCTCHPGGAR